MFKSRMKWLIILVIVPAIFIFAIYTLDKNDIFLIEKVNLEISTAESQKNFPKIYTDNLATEFSALKGQSLMKTSLRQISDILKKEKWIKDFRVSRDWPSELKITIQPYQLSYLLTTPKKLTEGLFTPVTESGDLLPEIDSRQAPGLALLVGDDFKKDVDKRKKAIELLNALPVAGKMNSKKVSEVIYDRRDGYWIQLIDSNVKIKFGENDFAIKSNRVSQVLDYLEKKDLKARVIDANLSKKVLVRLH
jgi:cell division protein FtsQ